MTSMQQFDCDGLTDSGKVRGINDDQFLIADLRKSIFVHKTSVSFEEHASVFGGTQSHLLMVADGGGGWVAERQASEIAIKTIARYLLNMMPWLYRLDTQHEDDFIDDLTTALERCQGRIETMAETMATARDLHTALTMAYITWPKFYVVHVGNCRCYILRRGVLKQVTTDHTLAEQFVEEGLLHEADAATSPLSQVLWNALGSGHEEMHPQVYKAFLQPGDVLLLCTDGLSHHLTDDDIKGCLQTPEPARYTCQKLIDIANDAGGTDNITVIVARFGQESQSVEDVLQEMQTVETALPPSEQSETVRESVVA